MYHNRFNHAQPLEELYNDLRVQLQMETAEGSQVQMSDMRVDLANNKLFVKDMPLRLGERAKSVLCERLKIGRIFDVVSKETMESVLTDINAGLAVADGFLTLKVRGDEIQGVVTERYNDRPYQSLLDMLEHLGARPIRVNQNDQLLRMQAIFEDRFGVEPSDGKQLNLGVEINTSDMGVGALKFNVFMYRWVCGNGAIMGKSSVGSFRTVHVNSMDQAEVDIEHELSRVLTGAQKTVCTLANDLMAQKYDSTKVVDYLGQQAIGKKPLALIVSKIVTSKPSTMWDVLNVLTAAGHDPSFSQSIQQVLETTAGKLLVAA